MTKKITYNSTYNNMPINTNEAKEHGVITDVMDVCHNHVQDMTGSHSKVFQIRFDLRYPHDGSVKHENNIISTFKENLTRKLKREKNAGGHKVDPRIIITVEQHGNSAQPHMHGLLLVNGNCKKDGYALLKQIEKTWADAIGCDAQGLVHYCNKNGENGIMIDRNKEDFKDKLDACSYQASYIAKARGKENKEKGTWACFKTRLPKK